MTSTKLLVVERLSVRFQTATVAPPAVCEIGFEVDAGQTLAVVGESGCGKTVMALALMGLLPPYASVTGRVIWRGRNLQDLSESARRQCLGRHLAMVFQEPATSLNPVYSVGEQIAEVLRHHHRISRRDAWRRTVQLLQEVRMPDAAARAAAYPHQLSGGMRQRVMLATALAGDPELLIADEPTTALDVTVQSQILQMLGQLRRDRGMAMIFITHDLALVPLLADRLAVMCGGRLVEDGPATAVLTAPAHPYTRELVGALPELWAADGSGLDKRDGTVPAGRSAAGCPYATCCPYAQAVCRARFPETVALEGERHAACLPDVARELSGQKAVP